MDDLVFGICFPHRWKKREYNCQVVAEIISTKKLDYPRRPKQIGRARLRVTISNPPGQAPLQDLVDIEHKDLAELIVDVANVCARAIRYRGRVSAVHELTAQDTPEMTFSQLHVERSEDGAEWTEVAPEDPVFQRLVASYDPSVMFDVERAHWVYLSLSLGSKHIPPEDEFIVNALEHFRQRNYKFTILELVNGLEIKLTQVLDEFLFFQTFMPKVYRTELLENPQFGLVLRLKGLLHLMLPEDYIRSFSMRKVLKLVNWRNKIVHGLEARRGTSRYDLPEEILKKSAAERHEYIYDHFNEVQRLLSILSFFEHQLGSADGRGIIPKKREELDEDLRPIRQKTVQQRLPKARRKR